MTILTNARIVTEDSVIDGTLVITGGRFVEIQPGRSALPQAIDCDDDFLLPGMIDLHTDNLDHHTQPRATARFPSRPALLAHDALCAAAGVTTVFDALCLGDIGFRAERVQTFRDALEDIPALAAVGLLRASHYLHLRCELPAPEMPELLDAAIDHPAARIVSLMDHSPGVGQYADVARYRAMREREGYSPEHVATMIATLQNNRETLSARQRGLVLARIAGRPLVLASHDDRSEAEVEANHVEGIDVSEFPVTMAAAQAATARGMEVIAGAPNIVRGGSHAGNVSAADMVAAGAVTALASDYAPGALIEAIFCLVRDGVLDLPAAVALVSSGPARITRLADRGRIAPGLRADFVRVRLHDGMPAVREVFSGGRRVA